MVVIATMLGAKWVDGCRLATLIHDNRRPPDKVVVHTETLSAGEILYVGDVPVTTAARTAFDLGATRYLGCAPYNDSMHWLERPTSRRSTSKR